MSFHGYLLIILKLLKMQIPVVWGFGGFFGFSFFPDCEQSPLTLLKFEDVALRPANVVETQ